MLPPARHRRLALAACSPVHVLCITPHLSVAVLRVWGRVWLPPTRHLFFLGPDSTPPSLTHTQPYADMPPEAINEEYLWGRLEPLLGYLPANERAKVRREREASFCFLPRCRDVGSLCVVATACARPPRQLGSTACVALCAARSGRQREGGVGAH